MIRRIGRRHTVRPVVDWLRERGLVIDAGRISCHGEYGRTIALDGHAIARLPEDTYTERQGSQWLLIEHSPE